MTVKAFKKLFLILEFFYNLQGNKNFKQSVPNSLNMAPTQSAGLICLYWIKIKARRVVIQSLPSNNSHIQTFFLPMKTFGL